MRKQTAPAKSERQAGGQPPLGQLEKWLWAFAWTGVVAGLLTPAVYAQVTWFAFTSLKVFWLQAVVGVSLPAYVVLAWRRPEFRPTRSRMALALAIYFGGVTASVLFARDPNKAWWGTLDRMDGLWSLLHFAAWAVMATGLARSWRDWRRLFEIELFVGLVAGCVAILQVPFPKILGQATDARVSGLFGNPIFSAAYHAAIAFLVGLLWAQAERLSTGRKLLYLATATTSLAALVLAGSRGPLLGLASGVAVTIFVFALLGRQRKAAVVGLVGLAGTVAIYLSVAIFVVPAQPQPLSFWDRHTNLFHLFLLHDNAGRMDFWKLVLSGIQDHPLVGWGQAGFEALFDRHYVPFERCGAGPQGADNAHNLVLQTLATTGLLGLAGLLFLWWAVASAILSAFRRGTLDRFSTALLFGLPTSHLVQLQFNPESPGTLVLCYLLVAFAAWLEQPTPNVAPAPRRKPGAGGFALAELAGIAVVVVWTILPAYASEMALLAVTDYRHAKPERAWHYAKKAASVPTPYLDDQLSVDLQLLVSQAQSGSLDRFPAWRELFALDRKLAERYLAQHQTVRFRMVYARLLFAVGTVTNDQHWIDEGVHRLRVAIQDHPKRQELMFSLAAILAERGNLDEAESFYRRALDEEPRVGESRFQLGRFLSAYRNLPSQGFSYIAEGTRGQCPYFGLTLDELGWVARALARAHDGDGLRALVSAAESLKPSASPRPYLAIAEAFEQAGMIRERDRILALGARSAPQLRMQSAIAAGK